MNAFASKFNKTFFSKFTPFGKNFTKYLKPRYLIGGGSFLFSGFIYYKINEQYFNPIKSAITPIITSDIVILGKNDYFDRILGNEKDFFFFIVHQDGHDNLQMATKAAKVMQSIIEENGYPNFNVYVINRELLNDIKKIIGRTKDINLFEKESQTENVEIYLKSPHSRDYLYMKFDQRNFFKPHKKVKIEQKVQKIKNIVEEISDDNTLRERLAYSVNSFNSPTVLLTLDPKDKKAQQKVLKKYKKLTFNCLERKLMPFDSNFLLVTNPVLVKKLQLEPNTPYLLQNDAVAAYERYADTTIQDNQECVEYDTENISINKIKLKKYVGDTTIFRTQKTPSSFTSKQREKQKQNEVNAFLKFVLPRVIILKDLNFSQIGQLFRQMGGDKEKMIVSLYCPPLDKERDEKLKAFMDIYNKYQDKFVYCILESDMIQEFFSHSQSQLPALTLFNFMKQEKDFGAFNHYYPRLSYPYEKYFLNPKSPYQPNSEEVMQNIEKYLQNRLKKDYLNILNDNIQSLSGPMHQEFFDMVQKERKNALIYFYDESVKSKNLGLIVDKLSIKYPQIKFAKINRQNQSKVFPGLPKYPTLLLMIGETQNMYLLNDDILQNESSLKQFINYMV